mgnify:CR=1 FL=1
MKKLIYLGLMGVVCVLISCGGNGTNDETTEEVESTGSDTTAVTE